MIVIQEDGKVTVTTDINKLNIFELRMRKMAILDLLASQSDDMLDSETNYFAIQMLKDLEPTEEQYHKMYRE